MIFLKKNDTYCSVIEKFSKGKNVKLDRKYFEILLFEFYNL